MRLARLTLIAAALLAGATAPAAARVRDTGIQDAVEEFRREREAQVAAAAADPFNCSTAALLFEQRVDHFSPLDARTWQQRWYVCDGFYARGSSQPVYVFLGDEGPLDGPFKSLWMDQARAEGGLLVFIEHRYYGESLPLGNSSFTNEGLRYLTVEQALQDYAVVTRAVWGQYGVPHKALTLAYGGSYGGSLAAYARQLHPDVWCAAHASSSVVKMVLPTRAYQAVKAASWTAMTAALRDAGGQLCADYTAAAFAGLEYLQRSNEGRQQLAAAVGMCQASDLSSLEAVRGLAFQLREFWWGTFQTQFKKIDPENWLAQACRRIPAYPATPLGAVAWLGNVTLQFSLEDTCFDANSTVLPYAPAYPRPTEPDELAWEWQCCLQGFPNDAMFDSVPPAGSLYGPYWFSQAGHVNWCRAAFGLQHPVQPPRWMLFNPGTYARLGRIIFASSQYDPWRPGAVLSTLGPTVPAITTPRASHCSELYAATPQTPPQVNATQARVKAIVRRWALERAYGHHGHH